MMARYEAIEMAVRRAAAKMGIYKAARVLGPRPEEGRGMMDDIVKRLRKANLHRDMDDYGVREMLAEAADEIERLRTENELWVPRLPAGETGVLCLTRTELTEEK